MSASRVRYHGKASCPAKEPGCEPARRSTLISQRQRIRTLQRGRLKEGGDQPPVAHLLHKLHWRPPVRPGFKKWRRTAASQLRRRTPATSASPAPVQQRELNTVDMSPAAKAMVLRRQLPSCRWGRCRNITDIAQPTSPPYTLGTLLATAACMRLRLHFALSIAMPAFCGTTIHRLRAIAMPQPWAATRLRFRMNVTMIFGPAAQDRGRRRVGDERRFRTTDPLASRPAALTVRARLQALLGP